MKSITWIFIYFILLISSHPAISADVGGVSDIEEPKMPDKFKNGTVFQRIMEKLAWHSKKGLFMYLYHKRNIGRGHLTKLSPLFRVSTEKLFNELGLEPRWDTNLTDSQHRIAATGYKYSIISRLSRKDHTGLLRRNDTGLCEDYKRLYSFQSEKYHTAYYLYESDSEYVLTFKSTSTLTEALFVDALIPLRSCTSIEDCLRIHSGFEKAINDLESSLFYALSTFYNNEKPIIFCGHSLGAALSTIASFISYTKYNIHPSEIYTFGSPQVGGFEFWNEWKKRIGGDIKISRVILTDEIKDDFITKRVPRYMDPERLSWVTTLRLKCAMPDGKICSRYQVHKMQNYVAAMKDLYKEDCIIKY
jgi:hypothetical protein